MKEDPEFYVPDLLSDESYELDPDAFSAADAHARHLHKAERLLNDTQNLTRVLRGSLEEAADARSMQVDTVLKYIDRNLTKAYRAIDKHGRRHSNLFLAYAESVRSEPK